MPWARTYDQYGRVLTETEPDAQETSRTNTYSYDASGRLTSNETNIGTTCNLNSYGYDQAGNRTNQTTGDCNNQTATSHSYNSFSQLTNPGYVYDELGRNTLIPAVDAPNQANGNITLAYNSTDDVTSINQGSSTTTFSYDTETRRLNETNNTVTTTRHYTDSTDNPTWVTENGSNPKTEIYTPSLGTGLNITTTLQGTTKTADIQLQDLRGNTVTTIDLATNITAGWNSYDEFGNPETPTNNTNLINYSSYSQAERATNATGLILMGARVYNPKTNQFTAPDPITGGNENTYTYPNDPINKSDFAGLNMWSDIAFNVGAAALTALACAATVGIGCLVAGVAISAASGFLAKGIEWNEQKKKTKSQIGYMLDGALSGAIDGLIGHGVGRVLNSTAVWAGLKKVDRKSMEAVRRDLYFYVPNDNLTKRVRNFAKMSYLLLKKLWR